MPFENLKRLEGQLKELQRRAATSGDNALRSRIMTFSQKVYKEMETGLADVEKPLTQIINLPSDRIDAHEVREIATKLDATHSREKFKNVLEICDRLDALARTYRNDIDRVLSGASGSYSELFWLLEKNEGIFRRSLESAVGDIAAELRTVNNDLEALRVAQRHAEVIRRELRDHLGLMRRARIDIEGRTAGIDSVLNVGKRADEVLRKSPWFSGSFYLGAMLAFISLLTFVSGKLEFWRLIIVIIGSYVCVTIVGALQLRNDNKLSEQNFLKLLRLALTRGLLPLLKRAH